MQKRSKWGARRTGKYLSQHEAEVAANLHALQRAGKISDLREQVPFELIAGKNGVRGVTYVADFTWIEEGHLHVADAKGWDKKRQKWIVTPVFRLKERMMFLLLGITIEKL